MRIAKLLMNQVYLNGLRIGVEREVVKVTVGKNAAVPEFPSSSQGEGWIGSEQDFMGTMQSCVHAILSHYSCLRVVQAQPD